MKRDVASGQAHSGGLSEAVCERSLLLVFN